MKIRTSFVTNSSSSSFIVAHNNQFTAEQKERLVEFALKNFLGDVTCSTDVGRILRTFKIKKNVEVTDNGKIII